MSLAAPSGPKRRPGPAAPPGLEDLLSIAVVIAAGCEGCADRMVRRALQRGSRKPSIARTLEVVSHLRAVECFVDAVGPQVIARMEEPLRAAQKALADADPTVEGRECCE